MGLLAPAAAWLALLTIPVVVLYFLKLKRSRLTVPSLVLWQRVLQDRRVNSPFQRFKRNILLLLQLLLLALLVLAAMQPYRSGDETARRLVVMIDCSASMGALDEPNGITRLEVARRQTAQMIDSLVGDREMCLISFGRSARRLTGFTNNKRVLHDALREATVQDTSANLEEALRMAQALARVTPVDRVVLLSDGNVQESAHLDLAFSLDFQQLPPAGHNAAITALSAKRGSGGRWEVFVRLATTSEDAQTARLELHQDGQSVAVEDVSLSRQNSQRLVFAVDAAERTTLDLRLRPDGFDALASDNVAYIDLEPARRLEVYVPPSLAAARLALAGLDSVRLWPSDSQQPTPEQFDLVITDQADDSARVAPVTMTTGFVPDDLTALATVRDDGTPAVDWQRAHPLLQHVEFGDVVFMDNPVSGPEVTEGQYEQLGYEVLVHGRSGPLILQRRQDQRHAIHMLFHIDRTTLPYRVAFPVLLTNVVQIAMQQAGLLETQAQRTGVLPSVTLAPNGPYTIDSPGGTRSAEADEYGVLAGVPAPRVGRYVVSGGGQTVRLSASLVDEYESSLAAVEQIQFKEMAVAAGEQVLPTERSLWRMLAAIAFCVLLFEWWFFQKRPG